MSLELAADPRRSRGPTGRGRSPPRQRRARHRSACAPMRRGRRGWELTPATSFDPSERARYGRAGPDSKRGRCASASVLRTAEDPAQRCVGLVLACRGDASAPQPSFSGSGWCRPSDRPALRPRRAPAGSARPGQTTARAGSDRTLRSLGGSCRRMRPGQDAPPEPLRPLPRVEPRSASPAPRGRTSPYAGRPSRRHPADERKVDHISSVHGAAPSCDQGSHHSSAGRLCAARPTTTCRSGEAGARCSAPGLPDRGIR